MTGEFELSPGAGAETLRTSAGVGAGPRGVTGAVEIRKRQPSEAARAAPSGQRGAVES